MPKYVLQLVDALTGDILDTMDDETFNSKEGAETYGLEFGGAFVTGEGALSLAGRSYIPRESVDFVVTEIEDLYLNAYSPLKL